MSNLAVATEIRNQLITIGKVKVMSWGAHNWAGDERSLIFKVQGHHFTGNVKITLTSMDDYTIEFFKPRTTEPVKTYEGIYFDHMVDVIDRYVEYIPAYKR